MTTQRKLIWDSGDSDKVYQQFSVVPRDGLPIGKPYQFKELMDGDVGVTVQIDLGKVRRQGLSDKQRLNLHSILLKMVVGVLTHKRLVIEPAAGTDAVSQQSQSDPAIIESGEEMPTSVHDLILTNCTEDVRSIIELLLSREYLSELGLEIAHKFSQRTGTPLLEALEKTGNTSVEQVAEAMADIAKVQFFYLDEMNIDPEVIASVPKNIVTEQRIVPVERKRATLVVASTHPLDFLELDNLRFILNCDVEYVIATKPAIDKAIERYYGAVGSIDEMIDAIHQEETVDLLSAVETDGSRAYDEQYQAANSLPVMKLVNLVLLQAIKANARKIVVSAEETDMKIRMEIDGVMYDMQSPPPYLGQSFIDRLKHMANIPLVSDERSRRTGRIDLQVGGRPVDIEVNFMPLERGNLAILLVSYSEPKKKSGGGGGDKPTDEPDEPEGPAPIGVKI